MLAAPAGPSVRCSSFWGCETLCRAGETHANCATRTFGGALYGATKFSLALSLLFKVAEEED
eukprot:8461454-Pyramimonas_sp.AAC.1